MTRILLDTNALVSFLTDRNEMQQEQVEGLLRQAAGGEIEIVLHQAVLTEMVYVLTNLYRLEPSEVAPLLEDLLVLPGVVPAHDVSWPAVLYRWPSPYRDLADALLAAVASQRAITSIATFDQALGKRLRREGLSTVW